jgi:nucleolar protein involved in exit from mitosis
LIERMKQEAERREKTEPELAEKLKDAVKEAEKDNKILGNMRDAREKLDKNQLNDAGKNQSQAAAGLENLARKLGRQTEAEQEQLIRRLRQAAEELEKIKKEEEGLRKKIKELEDKKQKGGLTPQQEDELKRLKKREEELQKDTQELAKRLSKDGRADRARQALERAAKNRDEMLERLNEAERELDRARQREQEVLEREQLTRILEVIERLRDRQAALIADTDDLRKRVKDFGKWTLGHRKSLLGLRNAQNGLKDEVEKIIPEDLASTPVFARMLQRSAEAMGLAAKRATDLNEEVAPEGSSPDKLPDAELTRQQKQALVRLEQVVDAVKSQLEAPPPPAPKQGNNPGGGDPGDGSPPPQNGLPPLAQLKLLKTLQLDVNKRSDEFHKAHSDLKKLSDAEQTEYNSIIRDQQDVRELVEEMRRPPEDKPAADKPAGPKPEEGMKK